MIFFFCMKGDVFVYQKIDCERGRSELSIDAISLCSFDAITQIELLRNPPNKFNNSITEPWSIDFKFSAWNLQPLLYRTKSATKRKVGEVHARTTLQRNIARRPHAYEQTRSVHNPLCMCANSTVSRFCNNFPISSKRRRRRSKNRKWSFQRTFRREIVIRFQINFVYIKLDLHSCHVLFSFCQYLAWFFFFSLRCYLSRNYHTVPKN